MSRKRILQLFAGIIAVIVVATIAKNFLAEANSNSHQESNENDTINLFEIEDGVLKSVRTGEAELVIPEEVTEIGESAFAWDYHRAENVQTITVPSNVKSVQQEAFAYCDASVIYFEDGVKSIGDRAFLCTYPSEIYFPASVTEIGDNIFENTSGLSRMIIHLVKGSAMDEYMHNYDPMGSFILIYDYDISEWPKSDVLTDMQ